MMRRLCLVLSPLSLLLFTAMAGLWVRSYWIGDGIGREGWDGDRFCHIVRNRSALTGPGNVSLTYVGFTNYDISEENWKVYGPEGTYWPEKSTPRGMRFYHRTWSKDLRTPTTPVTFWNRLGFRFEHTYRETLQGITRSISSVIQVQLPFWFLSLIFLTGSFPAWAVFWRSRRRRKRISMRLCAVCGYDLRATSVRCPECGTPIPPLRLDLIK